MTELKIADKNMYGYRYTGAHEPPTRVRVFAGTQIPPDLVDLEAASELDEQVRYPEATSASMTAEEQEQAARDREAAIAQPSQYNPDQPEDTMPRARTSATAQHTPEQRAEHSQRAGQQRSGQSKSK